jgi:hypothetical protein
VYGILCRLCEAYTIFGGLERQKKEEEIQDKLAERAFLMNVEELLTDFNWKANGNATVLEKRLLGELHALEAVRYFYLLL